MKKYLVVAFLSSLLLGISGCTEGEIEEGLVGIWNVISVQGAPKDGNPLPAFEGGNPTGTVTFNSNGTGEQNYSFTVLGSTNSQTGGFVWSATEELIIIQRVVEPDMEWTRLENTPNKQVASFSLDQNWDYVITLEK